MAYFADYSRVNSAVNGQAGYAGRLSGLSGTFSGNMNRLNGIAFDNLEKYGTVSENDMVDQAVTDTTLSYQKAYDTNLRNMERMGINPNSGRFQGMNQQYDLARAAAEAGARNQARLSAREQNYMRGLQMDRWRSAPLPPPQARMTLMSAAGLRWRIRWNWPTIGGMAATAEDTDIPGPVRTTADTAPLKIATAF